MRRGLTASVAIGVLLAGGAWLWYARQPAEIPAAVEPAVRADVWSYGKRHRYRIRYESSESVRPLADLGQERVSSKDAIQASLLLEGELVLEAHSKEQGVVTLRLTKLDTAELSIGSAKVPDVEAILTSGALAFRRGPRDSFTHYTQEEGANPLLVQTLRVLGMRMQVAAPRAVEEERFEIVEQLPHGRALGRYVRRGEGRWSRSRPRYLDLDVLENIRGEPSVQLSAEAKIDLRPDGVPASIDDVEELAVTLGGADVLRGKSHLTMTWISSSALSAGAPPPGKSRLLSEVPTSDQLEERMLSQRTEGLTREAAIALLRRHMNGGKLPDHRRALWRLTGLLEQQPEFARDLLALLLEKSTTSKGRALLLDLLVSVGHEEAQAAVRAALDSDLSRKDKARRMHYQRLGLIESPNEDTLQFAQSELERARSAADLEDQMLAAYTAAAVAGHALKSDDPALKAQAFGVADTISGLLVAAGRPLEQKHLIKALSNVKDERHHEQIGAFKDSEDDGVRQAVARAMKEPQSAEGLSTLVALVKDQDPFVQAEAIRALDGYALSDAEWNALIDLVAANGVHRRNHRILLDFVKYRRAASREATTRLLEAMLTLDLEGEVAGAVRLLLSR